MDQKLNIVNIPFALGSHRRGCDLGPKAIKYAGLMASLKQKGYHVSEHDIDVVHLEDESNLQLKNLSSVVGTANRTAKQMDEVLATGAFPLIIGGDHSIAIGTVAGVAKRYANLGVIWVDAHGDVNTQWTTPTGNIHGMPLAASLGFGDDALINVHGFSPKVSPANVVIIGARDLDPGEIAFLNKQNITYYSHYDVECKGISRIMAEVNQKFEKNGVEHIHLSFDLDVLEPSLAIGVGTPVQGGLTYRESAFILQELRQSNKLVSAEFVEMNPLFDVRNSTAVVAVSLINELF